ncbi:MAG: DNA starvation/stationary phase protection protein [Pseudomonadota bacterium]
MLDDPIHQEDKGFGAVADALQHVLGNTCRLATASLSCHWNVTGTQFSTLHLLFGEQYRELWEALDLLGERIRALDHPAIADHADEVVVPIFQCRASFPPANVMRHVLIDGHGNMIDALRAALDVARAADDEGTTSILGERLVAHERHRWMLRALD